MRSKLFIGVCILLLILIGFFIYSILFPKSPPNVAIYIGSNGFGIRVAYSQPYKKGRLIFGEQKDGGLQPYGKY